MSEAPEQIGLVEGLPGRWRLWTREDDGSHQDHAVRYVRADRLEAQEALLREAAEALEYLAGENTDDIMVALAGNPTRATAVFDAARATLAKLRSHMGGNHE